MTKLIAGIDEAGRGAIIGPLVIACVSIDKEKEEELKSIGVKDSKQLTREKREEIYKEIEKIAKDIVVVRIQACKIDSYREYGINLDEIEAMKIAQLINVVDADLIYIDSLEQNCEKFENLIRSYLNNKNVKLVVKNYLDESVPVVSAASIIAKVERDRALDNLKTQYNYDFGTGYPHDERVIKFIENLIIEKKEIPNFVRRTWLTFENIKEKISQRKLFDFSKKIKE